MRLGFYDYSSAVVGEDGVLFKAPLTSGAATYVAENGAGIHTYDDNGFTGTATSGLTISGFPSQSLLAKEGSFSCMLSRRAMTGEGDVSTQVNFILCTGNKQFILNRSTSGFVSGLDNDGSNRMNHKFRGVDCFFKMNAEATPAMVPFVFTWDGSGVQIYWNGLLIFDCPWTSSNLRCDFTGSIRINANASSGGDFTWKNVLVSSKKIVFQKSSLGTANINLYGNSYMQQGYYPGHASDNYEPLPLSGFTDSGVDVLTHDGLTPSIENGLETSASFKDACIAMRIHGDLSEFGLYTQRMWGWHQGGAGVEAVNAVSGLTIADRVTTSVNGSYPVPDVAVFINGYNDIRSATLPGTMSASWQTMLDELIAYNSNIKIIICTQPWHDHASFDNTLANVQTYNGIIMALGAANSEVSVVDMYTRWGGSSYGGETLGYWASDNIHPSAAGQIDYGTAIAQAIIASI